MSKSKIGGAVVALILLLAAVFYLTVVRPAALYHAEANKIFEGLQEVETQVIELTTKYPELQDLDPRSLKRKRKRDEVAGVLNQVNADLTRIQGRLTSLKTDLGVLEPPKKFKKLHLLLGETLAVADQLGGGANSLLDGLSRVLKNPLDIGAWGTIRSAGEEAKQLVTRYQSTKEQLVTELNRVNEGG